jgi:hypothetical protein
MLQLLKSYLFLLFSLSYTITSSSKTNFNTFSICFFIKELTELKDRLYINNLYQKNYSPFSNNTDNEIGIQDYGMRFPNIARFPSADLLVKEYPKIASYQFANNTPIQAIDLDSLGYFFMFSKVWGTEVVTKIEQMTGVSSYLLEGIEIKINELRSKIMSKHSGELSISSATFVEKLTMYFPHSFANFSNISEGWDAENTTNIPCDQPNNWLGRRGGQPCNNAHRTQVSALRDKGLIKISIVVKEYGMVPLPKQSLTLSMRSNQSSTIDAYIGKETTKNQTQSNSNNGNSIRTHKIDVPAKLRLTKVLLVIEHFVGTPKGVQRQLCGLKGDMPNMTIEIGVGRQIIGYK